MLADYQLLVAGYIQDTANKLDRATRDAAIAAAVATYSLHRPRRTVATVTGDGVTYDFAVPTTWEDGVSSILAVEHPTGLQDPEYLDADDVTVLRSVSTGLERIRFRSLVLSSGETAYVLYGISHTVAATTDTIPPADRRAVAKLAAAECALMLAAYYSQTSDPTFGADSINYRERAAGYIALADRLQKAYGQQIGVTDGVAAASLSADLDVNLTGGAGRPFFHDDVAR